MKRRSLFLLVLSLNVALLFSQAGSIQTYNVVWNSPSSDASGQMPLGNGDIAAGVYAIENELPEVPMQTIIPGKVHGGKLIHWSISPKSREGDVEIHRPQEF